MVLALIFRFLIHFQLITVYNVRKGSNFILLHVDRYSLDPALIAKKLISFPQTCPGIFIKKSTDRNQRVCFQTLNCISLISIFILKPVPHSPDHSSFIVIFEISLYQPSDFVFLIFFFVLLVHLLNFHMNLMINMSVSVRKPAGILKETEQNTYITLGSIMNQI